MVCFNFLARKIRTPLTHAQRKNKTNHFSEFLHSSFHICVRNKPLQAQGPALNHQDLKPSRSSWTLWSLSLKPLVTKLPITSYMVTHSIAGMFLFTKTWILRLKTRENTFGEDLGNNVASLWDRRN